MVLNHYFHCKIYYDNKCEYFFGVFWRKNVSISILPKKRRILTPKKMEKLSSQKIDPKMHFVTKSVTTKDFSKSFSEIQNWTF
jgi:hypothetical protein